MNSRCMQRHCNHDCALCVIMFTRWVPVFHCSILNPIKRRPHSSTSVAKVPSCLVVVRVNSNSVLALCAAEDRKDDLKKDAYSECLLESEIITMVRSV